MRRHIAAAALAGAALVAGTATPALAAEPTGTILQADSPTAIPGSYLVTLKKGKAADPALAGRYGGSMGRVFDHALQGFSVQMDAKQAARLAADPSVATVEVNGTAQAHDLTETNAPWSLDRADQRYLPLSTTYTYPNDGGSGITIYSIDTGITPGLSEFGGRARYGHDFVDNDEVAEDQNGHGTSTAGVAVGNLYGIAKSANVVGVRVLGADGNGTWDNIIAGINWVVANAPRGRSVINMSLGGGVNSTVDAAVRGAISAGIPVAVSAGNNNGDANNTSPARTFEALTVGATDQNDHRSIWPQSDPNLPPNGSNFGTPVDIFAPGTAVPAPYYLRDGYYWSLNGTSLAAPLAAGAMALYLSRHPGATAATVENSVQSLATSGAVIDAGNGSTNRLLFTSGLAN